MFLNNDIHLYICIIWIHIIHADVLIYIYTCLYTYIHIYL
jgi:hypothetical protein